MKIRILSSATTGSSQNYYASSMVINDSVCIDAGCIGFLEEPADQARIKHVFLTHAHLDHVASLPMFLENVFAGTEESVTIHASQQVHEALQRDMFNDRLWPDFVALSRPEAPFLRRAILQSGQPVRVAGVEVTPVEVKHAQHSFGFMLDDGSSAFMFSGDTAPTLAIWDVANGMERLKAVFLECSFPNSMAWLAEAADHLTPRLFEEELKKLHRKVAIHPISLKARYRAETFEELQALGVAGLEFPLIGETFEL